MDDGPSMDRLMILVPARLEHLDFLEHRTAAPPAPVPPRSRAGTPMREIREKLGRSSGETSAENFDDAAGRYRGLRGGQGVMLSPEDAGLIVKPEVARRQLDAETPQPGPTQQGESATASKSQTGTTTGGANQETAVPRLARRFHGTVSLDPTRVGRDAGRIAEEVIAHLAGQPGAEVLVTLEINVRLPNGASEQTVRTITENSRTLKFINHAFERE